MPPALGREASWGVSPAGEAGVAHSLLVAGEFVNTTRADSCRQFNSFQPLDIYLGARLSQDINEFDFQQFIKRFLKVDYNGGKMKRISNYVPKGELRI